MRKHHILEEDSETDNDLSNDKEGKCPIEDDI